MIKTKGEIIVTMKGAQAQFQLIPYHFPIPQNGIIGTTFLRLHKAMIGFRRNEVKFENYPFSFVESFSIYIPVKKKDLGRSTS